MKLKEILTKSKGARIVGSLIKGGTLDIIAPALGTITGAIAGTKESLKQIKNNNLSDHTGGQGRPNYIRIVGVLLGLMVLAYLFGWITEDQVNNVFGWFGLID